MSRPPALVVTSAEHGTPDAGDRIVLRRLAEFLQGRYDCEVRPFARQEGWRKVAQVAARGLPLELAPYWNPAHRRTLREALARRPLEEVFILHEGLFHLAAEIPPGGPRATLFAHNMLSRFRLGTPADAVLTALARRYERRWYAQPRARLVLISEGDKAEALARGVAGSDAPVAPPGAPAASPLRDDARFTGEAVATGRYGWWRKKRDLRSFAATGSALRLTAFDPKVAEAIPGARVLADASELDWTDAIRVGVITDRFEGGFKLKATEYVARNCVIFSRARIREEFAGLPHAGEFVVDDVPETGWAERIAHLRAAEPGPLAERFRIFKAACLARYDWAECLEPLDPRSGHRSR